MSALDKIKERFDALPRKQRQYAFVGAIAFVGFVLLWIVLSMGEDEPKAKSAPAHARGGTVTQIQAPGTMAPADEWIGTAGRKIAEFEKERQSKAQAEQHERAMRAAFEARVDEKLKALEQAQREAAKPVAPAEPPNSAPPAVPPAPPSGKAGIPPGPPGIPPQSSPAEPSEPEPAPLGRVSLGTAAATAAKDPGATPSALAKSVKGTTSTFLPVSIIRARLIAGMDAPTGGQAQSNPQPVLLRLVDNAVLPNQFRAQVKECFVVGAGYGEISSERGYIRTVSLSCVRRDGTSMEVDLKGNVYGEDGKLGMRGRLVTKQGQLLANALRAGIVGGIGEGFSQTGTTVSSGAFGTISTRNNQTDQNVRNGAIGGVGKAMDSLADYYIRLAEQMFPIIEIDAGRDVDIVVTRGVSLPLGPVASDDDEQTVRGQP